MIMTYFTYFKDYEGDKATGKNTPIVQLGLNRASFLGLFLSIIPLILFSFSRLFDTALFNNSSIKLFVFSYLIASLLFIYTGFLYYHNNTGDKTYFNLKYNFAALCASQAAIVSFYCVIGNYFNNYSGIYLYEGIILTILSVICVLTIFKLGYRNAKS